MKRKLKVVSCTLTINNFDSITSFAKKLKEIIYSWDEDTFIGVFPEYCWGHTDIEQVNIVLEDLISDPKIKCGLILGTVATKENDGTSKNKAIILLKNKIYYSSKEKVLSREKERNITIGKNIGAINYDGIRIGVLICADLWSAKLLEDLIITQKIDLLLIPAFTAVPKEYGDYARQQWLSLGISRSREFIIPIVIADHAIHGSDYDIGGVSCIIDPSWKSPKMKKQEDFLKLISKKEYYVSYTFDLEKIENYRKYRNDLGIIDF